LYVVFMLLAVPTVALLRRGHWRAVIGASLTIYCGGWLVGGVSFLPDDFSLTAWQALFLGGLLVGWAWEHERLRLPVEWRRRIVHLASVGAAGFLAMALVAPGPAGRVFGRLLDKLAGGPLAFLFAGLMMVTCYALVDRGLTRRWIAVLLTPIRILGSKGLPGYAALQVVGVGLDLFPGLPRNDVVVLGVIVVCGLTEYAAVKQQERRKRQLPGGSVPASDVAGDEPTGDAPSDRGPDRERHELASLASSQRRVR
jgi:hypothetical protein